MINLACTGLLRSFVIGWSALLVFGCNKSVVNENPPNLVNENGIVVRGVQRNLLQELIRKPTGTGVIWKGSFENTRIVWSEGDLLVENPDKTVRVFSSLTISDLELILKYRSGSSQFDPSNPFSCKFLDKDSCYYEREFKLLFVFGPIIGFSDKYTGESGQMSRGEDFRYTVVDVTKPFSFPFYRIYPEGYVTYEMPREQKGFIVSLEDIALESSLLSALRSQKELRWALKEKGLNTEFKSVRELVEQLMEFESRNERLFLSDYYFYLPSDFLTRFSIESYDAGKMKIVLALPNFTVHHDHKDIELILSPRSEFRGGLLDSMNRQQGFLGRDRGSVFGDAATIVRFEQTEK